MKGLAMSVCGEDSNGDFILTHATKQTSTNQWNRTTSVTNWGIYA